MSNKQDKMLQSIQGSISKSADLSNNTHSKINVELRSSKIISYLKPSEKQKLLSLIGRKSESDIVRDLILKFIKS